MTLSNRFLGFCLVFVAHLPSVPARGSHRARLFPSRPFLVIRSLADQPFGRLQERFGHLGPAPGIDPGEVLQGGKPIPVGRGGKVQGQAGGVSTTLSNASTANRSAAPRCRPSVPAPCGPPRSSSLPASGAVEHEHDIAGPAGELDPRWGDQRQRERSRAAVAFAVGVEGQRGVDGAAGRDCRGGTGG